VTPLSPAAQEARRPLPVAWLLAGEAPAPVLPPARSRPARAVRVRP
jgi:hypothetical protein